MQDTNFIYFPCIGSTGGDILVIIIYTFPVAPLSPIKGPIAVVISGIVTVVGIISLSRIRCDRLENLRGIDIPGVNIFGE